MAFPYRLPERYRRCLPGGHPGRTLSHRHDGGAGARDHPRLSVLTGTYVSIHSRPVRRLTPQPTDRGRADCPSLKGGVTKKDFIGSAVLSTTLFPLKGEVSNHKGIFDEQKCASSFWDEARSFFVLQRFGYGIAAPSDGPAYENSRGKAAACHRLSSLTGTKTARPQKQEKAGISTSLAFHWCRRGESNSHSVARTRP